MGNGPRTCKRNVGVNSRGGAWRKELCTAVPTVRAGTTRRMKKSSAFTGWSTSGARTHKVDSLLAKRSTSREVLRPCHAWISRAPALCSWEWGVLQVSVATSSLCRVEQLPRMVCIWWRAVHLRRMQQHMSPWWLQARGGPLQLQLRSMLRAVWQPAPGLQMAVHQIRRA